MALACHVPFIFRRVDFGSASKCRPNRFPATDVPLSSTGRFPIFLLNFVRLLTNRILFRIKDFIQFVTLYRENSVGSFWNRVFQYLNGCTHLKA